MKTQTKKFYAFDDRPPIKYRPGTSDEAIIQSVIVERKEYAFPRFRPDLVFDIGGNIGVLAILLANIYPDARIYSFEPVKENFEILKDNVSSYGNIYPMQVGLGSKTEDRKIHYSKDPTNFGGFSTHIEGPGDTEIVSIVDVEKLCEKIGTPDLIKIDAEGAEFEILSSIPNIDRVKWIAGELHGVKDYALLDVLDKHFNLQFTRNFYDKNWNFLALSKSWTDFGLDLSQHQ